MDFLGRPRGRFADGEFWLPDEARRASIGDGLLGNILRCTVNAFFRPATVEPGISLVASAKLPPAASYARKATKGLTPFLGLPRFLGSIRRTSAASIIRKSGVSRLPHAAQCSRYFARVLMASSVGFLINSTIARSVLSSASTTTHLPASFKKAPHQAGEGSGFSPRQARCGVIGQS